MTFIRGISLRLGADADVLIICLQDSLTMTSVKKDFGRGNRTFGTCSGFVIHKSALKISGEAIRKYLEYKDMKAQLLESISILLKAF